MDKKVDKCIKSLVSNTNFKRNERKDFKEYLYSNYFEYYHELIAVGENEETAMNLSLDRLRTTNDFNIDLNSNKLPKIVQNIFMMLVPLVLVLIFLIHCDFDISYTTTRYFSIKLFIPFWSVFMGISLKEVFSIYLVTASYIMIGIVIPCAMNNIYNIKKNISVFSIIVIAMQIISFSLKFTIYCNCTAFIFSVIYCCIGYGVLLLTLSLMNKVKIIKVS